MTDEQPETWVTRSSVSQNMPGWLEPSPDQLDHARKMLAEDRHPVDTAFGYVGGVLERFAAASFDADSFRLAIAVCRVSKEFSCLPD